MSVKVDLLRLEKEIIEFERMPVQKDKILFYGSSCFTRWKLSFGNTPLEEVIPGTLNHGFGSSTAEEQLYYYPRAIKPYAPRAIVHRTYGNDALFGYSPREIIFLTERLLEYARIDFPGIKFYLLGPEGNHWPNSKFETSLVKKKEYDELLRDYARHHEDCTYISIMESPMFFEKAEDIGDFRKIRSDIFIDDGVHFNKLGYRLFTIFLKDVLEDIL